MDFYNKSIIIFSFLLSACTTEGEAKVENFYTKGSGHYDVARLPIVEPYDIKSAICCSDWHIGYFSKLGEVFNIGTDVDSLFYYDKRIIIYCDDKSLREIVPEHHYYVLNTADSSVTHYYSVDEFRASYPIALWASSDAYSYIQKTDRPPWKYK